MRRLVSHEILPVHAAPKITVCCRCYCRWRRFHPDYFQPHPGGCRDRPNREEGVSGESSTFSYLSFGTKILTIHLQFVQYFEGVGTVGAGADAGVLTKAVALFDAATGYGM